jgi:hypothetical protein
MGCRAQIFWLCVGLVHCLPRRPCGQSRVISAGWGVWNRGGR